jgi:FixJ family two-component response regulator
MPGGDETILALGHCTSPGAVCHPLLLTDVVMPGLRGPHLARRLPALHPETRSPCASGSGTDPLLDLASAECAVELVANPISAFTLLTRVREMFDAGRPKH